MTNDKTSKTFRRLKYFKVNEEFMAICDSDMAEAASLQRMCYWSERVDDFDRFLEEEIMRNKAFDFLNSGLKFKFGFIYKKASQMADELCLPPTETSEKMMLRAFKSHVEKGFLIKRNNPHNPHDRTTQYRVDFFAIRAAMNEKGYELQGYKFLDQIFEETKSSFRGDQEVSENFNVDEMIELKLAETPYFLEEMNSSPRKDEKRSPRDEFISCIDNKQLLQTITKESVCVAREQEKAHTQVLDLNEIMEWAKNEYENSELEIQLVIEKCIGNYAKRNRKPTKTEMLIWFQNQWSLNKRSEASTSFPTEKSDFENLTDSDEKTFKLAIISRLNPVIFRNWFEDLQLLEKGNDFWRFKTSNVFKQEWIEKNYLSVILQIIQEINPAITRIEIEVC
jgi:hypothetical protein